jgi:hypothetical protein
LFKILPAKIPCLPKIKNAVFTVGVEADMFQKVQEEIKRLKIIVKGHEKRIKTLEDKLAEYNINYDDEDE